MAIFYAAGKVAIGTNAERTGGTWTSVAAGYRFVETDTNKLFIWSGSAWVEQAVSASVLTGTLGVASGGTGAATHTAGIVKASGTSAFTTVAAPSGAVVGTSDSQTLTTKAMDSHTNTFSNLQYFGQTEKFGRMLPNITNPTGEGILSQAGATIGTAAAIATTDSDGQYFSWTTGGTINILAGCRITRFTQRAMDPWFIFKIKFPSITDVRCYVGFSSHSVSPTTTADPLASQHGVGFWYDSAVNANWRIMSNNNTTTTNADSGVASATTVTTFEIKAITATPAFQWRLNGFPAGSWSGNVTATIPAATTALCVICWVENLVASTKEIRFYDLHVKQTA